MGATPGLWVRTHLSRSHQVTPHKRDYRKAAKGCPFQTRYGFGPNVALGVGQKKAPPIGRGFEGWALRDATCLLRGCREKTDAPRRSHNANRREKFPAVTTGISALSAAWRPTSRRPSAGQEWTTRRQSRKPRLSGQAIGSDTIPKPRHSRQERSGSWDRFLATGRYANWGTPAACLWESTPELASWRGWCEPWFPNVSAAA